LSTNFINQALSSLSTPSHPVQIANPSPMVIAKLVKSILIPQISYGFAFLSLR
jgi:hypothetical protein